MKEGLFHRRKTIHQKRRAKTSRFCLFLLVIVLVASVQAQETRNTTASKADEPKIVRVGWYEDSYHITGANGERSGYGYEYEQAVAAYTGWEYEYVKGDWSELLEKLQNGEIDLMAALSYTDERAKTMLFSELPMGTEKYYLYADLTDEDISAFDLSTLNGKRIVVMEKSVQATQFSEWEKEHNIKTQHVNMDSFEKAKEMAQKHEIDGVITTETLAWVEAGMSAVAQIGGSDIYYGINSKRSDLKEELDNAMRIMEYDKPFYADELYQRYLSAQSVAVLSSEEKEWISQHGSIRIGFLENDPGFSVLNRETGQMLGVINDYTMYATNCLENCKLNFDLTKSFDSEEEEFLALQNDEIDLIFHVSQNPYAAEQNDLALSNTVLTLNLVAVTAGRAFDEDAENSVAVKKGDLAMKWFISYNYPRWKIVEYDSDQEVKQAVQKKVVDCFLANASQLPKYINDKRLRCVFLMHPDNVSFGVRRGDAVLLSILNKTFKNMAESKLTGAMSMYDNASQKVTLIEFVKENLLAVTGIFATLFCVILLIILRLLQKAQVAEEKAKKAQIQAEAANAAKSTFLFNMSHDIRTPMNALLGYNQLMKKDLTDPKLLHYQEKIEQSGTLLLSIINNVLDMARIESGKMELDENYVQVQEIIEEVEGVFESAAKKKGICLSYEMDVTHQHILCDVTKVQQIFVNLVSNAVKYTPSGGTVTIKAKELPCDKEGFIRIQTQIIDTGIGMSKEYLPRMFDSFTRERNTTMGKVAGTGLGMPIVKKITDLMGGTIEVESELGKGTKFTVTLQYKLADEKYYKQKDEDHNVVDKKEVLQGKHILLAEDNELNAEIAITILEEMGLKIDRVEDGIQCVSKIEQMPAGSFDLILMDIQMPNMDGYKATQAIRGLSDSRKAAIPIVAMTANAFEEDKKKAFAKGMNGHIAKPIDVEKVEEVLLSILK